MNVSRRLDSRVLKVYNRASALCRGLSMLGFEPGSCVSVDRPDLMFDFDLLNSQHPTYSIEGMNV